MEPEKLLTEPDTYPSEKVLEDALGERLYAILETFLGTISDEGYGTEVLWKYYKDGKSWLGRVTRGKKTVLWLSVWDGYLKVSFYFTEKHRQAISGLDISESVKVEFSQTEPSGKLIPMIFDVDSSNQIDDILAIVAFKIGLT